MTGLFQQWATAILTLQFGDMQEAIFILIYK